MCERFTLHTNASELQLAFKGFIFPDDENEPRYNIAPSLNILTVSNEGGKRVTPAKWGLIPFWAKEPKIGNRLINARAETLAAKPAFRDAYRHKRCLTLT